MVVAHADYAATVDALLGLPPTPVLQSLELCAGAGGAALGIEAADFEPLALIDNDPHACATLHYNRPTWNIIEADIRDLDFSYLAPLDLLAAGLPCPPYSIAGVQRGAADERDLFPDFLRIVTTTEPRAVIVENVRGLMGKVFAPIRSNISATLTNLGYAVYWQVLNAAGFDVPQNRRRVFLVAIRDERQPFTWPTPTPTPRCYVGPALVDLLRANGWAGADTWAARASRFLSPTLTGGSKKHGGPDLGPTRAREAWKQLGVHPLMFVDEAPPPEGPDRLCLTTRMVARLQGFPDDWEFTGSKTQQHRQIGNALPPPLMQAVAEQVAACLR